MAEISFDDLIPKKSGNVQENPFVDLIPKDDHGLARRQQMSQAELALSPITEYPRNYREMRQEAQNLMASGISDIANRGSLTDLQGTGLYDIGKGLLKTGAGALGFVGSPISAAYRSLLGQPVEDITGIPREQTEFAAQLATPGIGFPGAAREAPLRGVETTLQRPPPIEVPRALTSEKPGVQSLGVMLSKTPLVGTPLQEGVYSVPGQVGRKIEDIAGQFSPEMPQNVVGGGVEQTLGRAAEREATAAQAAAEADLATRRRAWEQANQAREQAITQRQAQATSAAERQFGNVAPMEMAQDTIGDIQSAERQARARKEQLYGDVNALDARINTAAFSDLRQRAEHALVDAGVDIDNPGSNASNMLRELDRLSGRPGEPAEIPQVKPRVLDALRKTYGDNIPPEAWKSVGVEPPTPATEAIPPAFRMAGRHAPAPGEDAISVQGLEHLSKRIGRMGMEADTPADRYASSIIKRSFDDWRNDALGSHLTADSEPNAGETIAAARAAHRDLMERFGYNYARMPEGEPRNAAKLLNQTVTGGIGPEGLRDSLIGAKPGNRRVSAPLYEMIGNALPNAEQFRNRVRGAYWNEIGQGSPAAVARNVEGLTPTRMGSHLFTPEEHNLMRGYAQLSQDTPTQLREAARLAREGEPELIRPQVGRAQQIARQAIGRGSNEEVFSRLDSALKGGDIKQAARTWGAMTDANRNEFRGAFLRNLGGGGEDFSLAKFVTNWDNYSDQAKVIMFGRDHREDIQKFYDVAKQFKDAVAKYGNPSGTAQHTAWQKIIHGGAATVGSFIGGHFDAGAAAGALAVGVALRGVSMFLATPRGASQVGRFARLAQAYERSPTNRTAYLLGTTGRAIDQQAKAQ